VRQGVGILKITREVGAGKRHNPTGEAAMWTTLFLYVALVSGCFVVAVSVIQRE
jgi:hypothetical protein